MANDDDVRPVGLVETETGDTVEVGLQAGKVHVELANPGREPVEVWLTTDEASFLAEILTTAAATSP
jgi:hypothetical protein